MGLIYQTLPSVSRTKLTSKIVKDFAQYANSQPIKQPYINDKDDVVLLQHDDDNGAISNPLLIDEEDEDEGRYE